jgi:hypothetical protein
METIMPTEKEDESLGLEQLPQTELDSVPGAGEKSDADTGSMFKGKANTEGAQPGSTKPSTDDAQAE